METYTFLREFADSWMLLVLVLIFLGVFVWVWRPGSKSLHDDAAGSIFRHDMKPADDDEVRDQRSPAPRQPRGGVSDVRQASQEGSGRDRHHRP